MNTMCVQADRILSKPVGLSYRGIVQLRRPCIILAFAVLGFPSSTLHNTVHMVLSFSRDSLFTGVTLHIFNR